MPEIRADGVAIYVYRKLEGRLEFLQMQRVGHGDPYAHTWQTVYGSVEKGETAVQAAWREFREETGLTAITMWQIEHLESFYFLEKDYVCVMPVFAVEVPAHARPVLDHEHEGYRWVPETQLSTAFMWRSQHQALAAVCEMIHNGSAAAKFLKVAEPANDEIRMTNDEANPNVQMTE